MDVNYYLNYFKYFSSILYDNLKHKEPPKEIKKHIKHIIALNNLNNKGDEIKLNYQNIINDIEKFINYQDKDYYKDYKQEQFKNDLEETRDMIIDRISNIIRNEILSKVRIGKNYTEDNILNYNSIPIFITYTFYDYEYFICIDNIKTLRLCPPRSFKIVKTAVLNVYDDSDDSVGGSDLGRNIDITELIKKYQGPFGDFHTEYTRTTFKKMLMIPYSIYNSFGLKNIPDSSTIKIVYSNKNNETTTHYYKMSDILGDIW